MKKIFSFNLYRESIRQTKMLGIMLAVITIIGSALIPILSILNYYSYEPRYRATLTVSQVSILDFAPVLLIFALIAPVLLCMNLFSFLNKRKASDFYHSIPDTRTCVYTSFSASIMTWITAVITVTVAICMILYSISPLYIVNFSIAVYTFLSFFACAVLVMGVVMLAKSITGTAITNIIVAGIIGFFPRFLIYIFSSLASSMIVIAEMDSMGILMNSKYNIPVNLVFSAFTYNGSLDMSFVGGIIYTFVLGIIYLVLGAFLFGKRKSETAEKSAPNKFMQHVFRCLITIPVALMIPVMIMEDSASTGSFLVIGFITLVIYYGYELLTTKKFKNLLTATPVLAVVIVFDILFGVSLTLTRDITLSFTPEVSEIKEVNVLLSDANWNTPRYNDFLTEKIYNDDETLKKYVSDELKNTVEVVKNKNMYFSDVIGERELRKTYIKTASGKTVIRKIYFNHTQSKYITNLFLEDEKYAEALSKLPELNGSSHINIYRAEDKVNELWELYKEEYENLSIEEKLYHNHMSYEIPESLANMKNFIQYPERITFYGYYKTDKFASQYMITSKTPKTMEFLYKCLNEKEKKGMTEAMDEILGGNTDNFNFSLDLNQLMNDSYYDYKGIYNVYINGNGDQITNESSIRDFTKLAKFFDIIKDSMENDVDVDQPIYSLQVSLFTKDGDYDYYGYGKNNNYYINLTDENLDKIVELTKRW